MGNPAYEDVVPVPRIAIDLPLELPPPPGFDPTCAETWPAVEGQLEYVDGKLLFMPPTGDEQQYTCLDLYGVLSHWLDSHPDFRVGGNEAGMVLGGATRGADAAVWRRVDTTEVTGGFQRVPPVLAAEVAGKYDEDDALRAKAKWYLDHGVEIVWLVFPKRREVQVLTAAGEATFRLGEQLSEHPALPGLAPVVDALFRQLSRP
jgi:Uma2 family endonuclease